MAGMQTPEIGDQATPDPTARLFRSDLILWYADRSAIRDRMLR
eukprot:IDg5067t1